ncbi:MAG TPA: hypothetical protein VMV50_00660 [Candidatus Paceibacterota bacterium]|nr:hypothetical protein [Candidatus Paceibacterota bacterium]
MSTELLDAHMKAFWQVSFVMLDLYFACCFCFIPTEPLSVCSKARGVVSTETDSSGEHQLIFAAFGR